MPDQTLRQSPLERFGLRARQAATPHAAAIRCWEQAFLGHINLRGDTGDPQFASAIASVLGAELPTTPNTTSGGQGITIYWLGPDEWLIVTPGERERGIANELRAALGAIFSAVTELAGGQTVVVLRGAAVRELLAKACPLDFHPRSFPVGTCAQSRLAKAPVLLRPLDDDGAFEIVIRRSYADYFWLWLEDAAAEHGLCVSPEAITPRPSQEPA